jgi:hypothetical protein
MPVGVEAAVGQNAAAGCPTTMAAKAAKTSCQFDVRHCLLQHSRINDGLAGEWGRPFSQCGIVHDRQLEYLTKGVACGSGADFAVDP